MWIKSQSGSVYRREAFYLFEVDSTFDAGISHHYLRARLRPPEASAQTSGLKSIDPSQIVLGDYPTELAAHHALDRIFPEHGELVDLTVDVDVETLSALY